MRKLAEITYEKTEEDKEYERIINKIFEACFKEEDLYDYSIYVSVIISDEELIKKLNAEKRNIDKVTDVL